MALVASDPLLEVVLVVTILRVVLVAVATLLIVLVVVIGAPFIAGVCWVGREKAPPEGGGWVLRGRRGPFCRRWPPSGSRA